MSGGKGASTPGGKDIGRDVRDSDCELEYSDAKLVQAAAGLEQYIALDRPDIAYSVKTALQQMSNSTKLKQLRVVRVWRYLKNNPRLVWKFPYQQQPKSIDVFVDADFAARETILRSTSGVAEYYGRATPNGDAVGSKQPRPERRRGKDGAYTVTDLEVSTS